jgi:hypothetical protein
MAVAVELGSLVVLVHQLAAVVVRHLRDQATQVDKVLQD